MKKIKKEQFNEEYDKMPLCHELNRSFDSFSTGLNNNRLVVATTGGGKTTSVTIPQILCTYNQSLVVSLGKKNNLSHYVNLLKLRGYKVEIIDLVNPEESTVGYDPFKYIDSPEEILSLARKIMAPANSCTDAYWNLSAANMIIAFMFLSYEEYKDYQKEHPGEYINRPTFDDVLANISFLRFEEERGVCKSNFDKDFNRRSLYNPLSEAYRYFKPFIGGAYKTHMCTYATLMACLNQTFSEKLSDLMAKEDTLDIPSLGKEKTAVFIISDPVSEQASYFANLLYSDLFTILFKESQKNKDGCLNVPVHIICDDFACTSKIEGFERYISVMRGSGISATLLLQDIAQLKNIYGEAAAQIIISNCDTLLFMGSMDNTTCRIIGEKLDIPPVELMQMPKGHLWVIQRGEKPVLGERYRTFEDPEYIEMMKENENEKN